MSHYPPIVAFAAPAHAGKSTSSHLLLDAGYQRVSFARSLKDMLLAIGLTEQDLNDPVLKEAPHPLLGGRTPRFAMQTLGTEWGRETIWDDIWVNLTRIRVEKLVAEGHGVVFDDARFDNEALPIRQWGGVIVEVTRKGCSYNPAIKSEAGLSRHLIDVTVPNDGTVDELHVRLDAVLSTLLTPLR